MPSDVEVHAAATATDARQRLVDVRAGSLHALNAYRFLHEKLEAKGSLSPEEQVKFERAQQALAEAVGTGAKENRTNEEWQQGSGRSEYHPSNEPAERQSKEQQHQKAPRHPDDPLTGPPDFEIPADSEAEFQQLGWNGDPDSIWADSSKIQQLIDQTDAAGHFKRFDEGAEAEVYPLGKNWVLKQMGNLMDNTLPRWVNVRHDKGALMDRVTAIRALDGLETYAMTTDDGKLLIIQERGSKITPEEYKAIVLKGGIKPAERSKMIITIGGRRFLVSDLHEGNFLKDKNGVIRVSDLLAGEIKNATTPLWGKGDTPPSVHSRDK